MGKGSSPHAPLVGLPSWVHLGETGLLDLEDLSRPKPVGLCFGSCACVVGIPFYVQTPKTTF